MSEPQENANSAWSKPLFGPLALPFIQGVLEALKENPSRVVALFYSHPDSATEEQKQAPYEHSIELGGQQDGRSDRQVIAEWFPGRIPSFDDIKALEGLSRGDFWHMRDSRGDNYSPEMSQLGDFLDRVDTLTRLAKETLCSWHVGSFPLESFHPADVLLVNPDAEFIDELELMDPAYKITWDRFEWITRNSAAIRCYLPASKIPILESYEKAQRFHVEDWSALYNCINA